jgi:Ser/Thr protein kinase RdoA (MazF antagonist)
MTIRNLAVTESTISAHDLGTSLQEPYGLSRHSTCKIFRTGINHLYILDDHDSKFVFRVYTLNWRTELEISEEVRLLGHLCANDIPVAYPIADKKGNFIQYLIAPEGIRFGVLFSFARGKKIPQFTEATSFSIGSAMARMHQLTSNFILRRVTYDAHTLLENSYNVTSAFFAKGTEEMTFVERATKFLINEYKTVKHEEIRSGAVHLDIWFDNLHVTDENEVTLFDFDFCGNGWLCHDIAYYMLQLYNTRQSDDAYQKKLESFVNGYESIQPITGEEKRIIPLIAVAIWLFYLGVQCERFDNWSNVFLTEDHLKRFIATIKKWMAYQNLSF